MTIKQADIRIEGLGTISEGEYRQVKVEGVGKMKGHIVFDTMSIEGTCNADHDITGRRLDVEGIFKVKGNIRLKELAVEGILKTEECKIYADEIRVDGLLKNNGEVNADNVIINGCANINNLFGDQIEINYGYRNSFFHFGPNKFFAKMNKANNIECSKLDACNLTCNTICATDVVLSNHCIVDTLHCDGTLKFDSTCRIRHIEGDCVQQKN